MRISLARLLAVPALLIGLSAFALASDLDIRSRQVLFMAERDAEARDEMLDVISTVYLPPTSKAQRAAFRQCGDSLFEFVGENPEPFSEQALFDRAREMQKRLAPQELIAGPRMTKASCRTPNCGGTVKFADLPLIRAIDPASR